MAKALRPPEPAESKPLDEATSPRARRITAASPRRRLDLGVEVRDWSGTGCDAVAPGRTASVLRALGRLERRAIDRRLAGEVARRRARARGSIPARRLRASILSRTSRRSGIASNAVTSIAISFVSPSLWSTRPLTTRTRSVTQQLARGGVDRVEDDDLGAAGDVVEPQEDHRVALLRRQLLDRGDDPADGDDLAVAAALELGERRSRSCAAAGRGSPCSGCSET